MLDDILRWLFQETSCVELNKHKIATSYTAEKRTNGRYRELALSLELQAAYIQRTARSFMCDVYPMRPALCGLPIHGPDVTNGCCVSRGYNHCSNGKK